MIWRKRPLNELPLLATLPLLGLKREDSGRRDHRRKRF